MFCFFKATYKIYDVTVVTSGGEDVQDIVRTVLKQHEEKIATLIDDSKSSKKYQLK